jgi:hypothetical protein
VEPVASVLYTNATPLSLALAGLVAGLARRYLQYALRESSDLRFYIRFVSRSEAVIQVRVWSLTRSKSQPVVLIRQLSVSYDILSR